MFQYTKETILDNIDGVAYNAATSTLTIKGVGEYVLTNVADSKYYKAEGVSGAPGELTLPVDDIKGDNILQFNIITPGRYFAEYASPSWQTFGKPVVIAYNETDGTKLKNLIELAIPESDKGIKVKLTETDIVITGSSNYMAFEKAFITAADDTVTAVGTTTANVQPFATQEWLIENLRLPTYNNIRYTASKLPKAALYDQYTFIYKVPRVGLGGVSGVGQALEAVTNHVFYVPRGKESDDFTALLESGEILSADA